MSKLISSSSELDAAQALRQPVRPHDLTLHDQLYRYAEDLEQSIEKCLLLETQCKELTDTCAWLDESRRELDKLVFGSKNIHFLTDTIGTILHSNPAASALASPLRLAGCNLGEWVLADFMDNFHHVRANAVAEKTQAADEWELHLRQSSNTTTPMIVAVRVVALYRHGKVNALHWVMRNITYLREIEFDSQISTLVFKGAAEGVMITDIDGEIITVNPAFTQITGYEAEEAIGRNVHFQSSGVQDEAFYAEFWRVLREKGVWQGELYNRRKSGEMYPEWLSISAARNLDGRVLSYVAMFSDVSRLLRAEKRLEYMAHYDTLTGLPNRHLFEDRLDQALANGKRSGIPFTLIFIDLDDFKKINDSFGHHAGDKVLQAAGKRLQASIREIDTVSRLGGDEFVVIAPGLNGSEDIARVCSKAIEALVQPIDLDGKEVKIGGSFGCAQYPQDGDDASTLLKCADKAMYCAKAAGGNVHVIHEAASLSVAVAT
jgi:diguanylate cyclase (GGDEF)-like protein/PAS domain S-box-containing protein